MCGDLFGQKSAKKQAAATLKAAEDQAQADRYAAEAAVRSQATTVAQIAASDKARDLLDRPMDQVEVDLNAATVEDTDPMTGRRRPARAAFRSARTSGSGIQIP